MALSAPQSNPITVNAKLVALLEKKLADAKAGKMAGAAVISCYAGGGIMVDTEGDALALHSGADELRDQMRMALYHGQAHPAQVSPPFGSRRFSS